ncbi:cytochrome P450 2K1-like isoform X2 [Sander lucioperca]|uniref:cytochrome P450 2K1-like isoform X2 n=1 Tax=Sander lucioperca TaxID=283035 RepID=UPI00165368DA|nr:cytochrome P450 2K1-like isoform X2 [Sander lucioperca]
MGVLELFLQSSSSISLLGGLLVLLLVYLVSSSSFSSKEDRKEPPGPKPFPLIGNLLQLDLKRLYNTLLKLSKRYGSVFTVYLGPQKVVVLAGYKTVKEALVNYAEEFGERDPMLIMEESNQGHGLIWANGDSWKEMRRFALTNLRDFGMGKKASEDKIIEECDHLIEVFKTFKGEAFDSTQPINYAVSNIICSIVYGSRFEYDDPEFTSLVDRTNRYVQLVGSPSVQESGIANSYFNERNLLQTVINLFGAGTDTTATTLRWGLLFMAKNPKIQDQVQEELSREIGSRNVQVEDRKNLPFTDAVIHETQRLANIAPMAVPHKTSQDITFQGHFIKKGTTVYPLLTSVLYDESEWERPHSFYPAHFLDKDGKFVKREAFMPFSAGRRICPGESLARMELFIFFTTLLQHFRFTPPPGVSEDELDLTPRVGFTLSPSPHKLCAVSCM